MRYPALKRLGKAHWIKIANAGHIANSSSMKGIGNINLDLDSLESDKLRRAKEMFETGKIELPIVIKINNKYDLLAGNTRFAYLTSKGISPKIWLINIK